MELEQIYSILESRGYELVAISTDDAEQAGEMAEITGATFPVLADPDHATTSDYGVYNLLGDGVATPATFIVDSEGMIRWQQVGQTIADRPSGLEILDRLDSLFGASR